MGRMGRREVSYFGGQNDDDPKGCFILHQHFGAKFLFLSWAMSEPVHLGVRFGTFIFCITATTNKRMGYD